MPNTMVIDLSHHNSIPQSLRPAANAGVLGVIHKMSEGTGNVDRTVDNRKFLSDEAGLLWGLYHFLRPGNMKDQVDHFLSSAMKAKVLTDETLLAADYEDERVSIFQLQEFMTYLEELSGRAPVLYSGHVLKEKLGQAQANGLVRYRLWLAQYGSKAVLPPGWDKYWLWQWTDKGTVPGVKPPTDCNDFQGSAQELEDQWSGREVSSPVSETETTVIRITVPKGSKVDVTVEKENG